MRKSKLHLTISILCLVALALVCLVFRLPNTLNYNILRVALVIIGCVAMSNYTKEINHETIKKSKKSIEELRKEHKNLNDIVDIYSTMILKTQSHDFIDQLQISLDKDDSYLLDFDDNLQYFKSMINNATKELNQKIEMNPFVIIACVMDSLISGWKIKSAFPEDLVFSEHLVLLNCQVAICVALELMHITATEDNIPDSEYVTKLTSLLYVCYTEKQYGNLYCIELEALLLELIYKELTKTEKN